MPRVLNRFVSGMPDGSVYIGRPSKWGNPFVIGRHGDRAEVLHQYEKYLEDNPWLWEAAERELRGRDLICWCAPQRCHGDILLVIANGGTTAETS